MNAAASSTAPHGAAPTPRASNSGASPLSSRTSRRKREQEMISISGTPFLIQGTWEDFSRFFVTAYFKDESQRQTRNAPERWQLSCQGYKKPAHQGEKVTLCHAPGYTRPLILKRITDKYSDGTTIRCDLKVVLREFLEEEKRLREIGSLIFLCDPCDTARNRDGSFPGAAASTALT